MLLESRMLITVKAACQINVIKGRKCHSDDQSKFIADKNCRRKKIKEKGSLSTVENMTAFQFRVP